MKRIDTVGMTRREHIQAWIDGLWWPETSGEAQAFTKMQAAEFRALWHILDMEEAYDDGRGTVHDEIDAWGRVEGAKRLYWEEQSPKELRE